jgi:hypothetical protein
MNELKNRRKVCFFNNLLCQLSCLLICFIEQERPHAGAFHAKLIQCIKIGKARYAHDIDGEFGVVHSFIDILFPADAWQKNTVRPRCFISL